MLMKMAEYLDKIVMAVVALAALVVAVIIFRDDIPALGRKYKNAQAEAAKSNYGLGDDRGKDPKGLTTVTVIKNGKITSITVTREERDRILRQGR
jgi:hypothetical protein